MCVFQAMTFNELIVECLFKASDKISPSYSDIKIDGILT